MSKDPFAPALSEGVLRPNFAAAKVWFLGPLLDLQRAHLVMLAEQGIVSREDAGVLRDALARLPHADVARAPFESSREDLFGLIEARLVESCGRDVAAMLHTARSRNDIDMTVFRMRHREALLDTIEAAQALRGVLLQLAAAHRDTVFIAHTHTQQAQPTTLAHYLLAVVEQLERDDARLRAAYDATNRCPLGACAITGTGFPIDRGLTSGLLGFSAPTGNTYGSIAGVDYLLQSASAIAVMLVELGRVLHDLLLWSMQEIGYLTLPDDLVQGSTIMPQKRNPIALEHARALASKAVGQALALLTALHNTPYGDIVDTQDDVQPAVMSMFEDANRALRLVAAALERATIRTGCMRAVAERSDASATELADALVRDHGVPFRLAHAVVRRFLEIRAEAPVAGARPIGGDLAVAAREIAGRPIRYDDVALERLLSPDRFVAVRRTLGGPAPEVTAAALEASTSRAVGDGEWLAGARGALRAAEARLAERFAAI